MNKIKLWAAQRFFGDLITSPTGTVADAASGQTETILGIVKRLGVRNGDITSKEFEPPEFDMTSITNGYNTDSYIRQGVDKYVDQIFKEGYKFYGRDENVVNYLKLRFAYMAEASSMPTDQLLMDIAEDIVKYGNCIVAKARAKDPDALPPTASITGLNGKEAVAGYFPINATTVMAKRDKNGTVTGWQQEVGDAIVRFKPEDIIHFYYKRENGNAFGTSFLIPVLDDVRALRQAEENVLRMMYRNIYPFYHIAVGDNDVPGTENEINEVKVSVDDMEIDGGLVTTNRVKISPIAADRVIDAHPYLQYLEQRVFSGMGIPAIMFGRGDTANRSTGDSMTSEMSDRIHAMQHSIEMFINQYMVRELLMEGGYDPILNPDQAVEFRFVENDLERKIKEETHVIFKYEHNMITEDEARSDLNLDPITDRSKMHQALITQANAAQLATLSGQSGSSQSKSDETKTKETDNKIRPTNQHGTKSSPKKVTNSDETLLVGFLKDEWRQTLDDVEAYVSSQLTKDKAIKATTINCLIDNHKENVSILLSDLTFDESELTRLTQLIDKAFEPVCDENLSDQSFVLADRLGLLKL